MGFADSVATNLFLNRRKSDIEYKIQIIMQRKLAIMDECNQISQNLAESIFDTDQTSLMSPNAPLPGLTPSFPTTPAVAAPSGYYETVLLQLQSKEKELDCKQKKLETELEAVKAEEESMKKIADDHAKKDFKIGS